MVEEKYCIRFFFDFGGFAYGVRMKRRMQNLAVLSVLKSCHFRLQRYSR